MTCYVLRHVSKCNYINDENKECEYEKKVLAQIEREENL